jgi:hypothetical protein
MSANGVNGVVSHVCQRMIGWQSCPTREMTAASCVLLSVITQKMTWGFLRLVVVITHEMTAASSVLLSVIACVAVWKQTTPGRVKVTSPLKNTPWATRL